MMKKAMIFILITLLMVSPVYANEKQENIEEEIYYDNICLLAQLAMAEAEGESDLGKRLVIDTVLNRVDSVTFPNDISEVVYQTNQFSCIKNGRMDRCYPTTDICKLVEEELEHRTNCSVLFFTSGGFSSYGKAWKKIGGHYFSTAKGE